MSFFLIRIKIIFILMVFYLVCKCFSGKVTGDAPVICWPNFSLSLVTNAELILCLSLLGLLFLLFLKWWRLSVYPLIHPTVKSVRRPSVRPVRPTILASVESVQSIRRRRRLLILNEDFLMRRHVGLICAKCRTDNEKKFCVSLSLESL